MPIATRRYTFRLYPNKAQTSKLFGVRRLHCYLYNAALAHRKTEYERFGKSVDYFQQQNVLPAFKEDWPEYKELNSQTLQATLKRIDFAYNRFFRGLAKRPKFKSIKDYSGWTYPGFSGWDVSTNGKHGQLILRDLGITLKMRGKAKQWGVPTTLTILYKPSQDAWYASFTVNVEVRESRFGQNSDLSYESILAIDLGTQTAITGFDGTDFTEVENPRFVRQGEKKVQKLSKQLRRKRSPNWQKKIKASKGWRKARKRVSIEQRKVANQRKNWQHQVTTEISRRYDIVVTEKLETQKMTRKAKKGSKRKRQKAGLNKSILDVGFGTLNQMIVYKVEAKGGVVIELDTRKVKPSQRCPQCGIVHKDWADLSNRYHVCDDCHFEGERDRTSCVVMYNVATNRQPGLGTHLVAVDATSTTSEPRTHTGGLKQLGQMKRSKRRRETDGEAKPHRHALG